MSVVECPDCGSYLYTERRGDEHAKCPKCGADVEWSYAFDDGQCPEDQENVVGVRVVRPDRDFMRIVQCLVRFGTDPTAYNLDEAIAIARRVADEKGWS